MKLPAGIMLLMWTRLKFCHLDQPFPKPEILYSSKLKELAEDNFEFQ